MMIGFEALSFEVCHMQMAKLVPIDLCKAFL